ncbi:Bacteriophage holin [Clostridium cavendishii DSM 21758]|uniref:Bacteriophage holin n=1 Tax=Clostridium cavendishii DSM 21758 TaxID=1121302 RepID=A0A1M6HTT7_9CLOT|nr:phage holin [Clostridium cavendishii]SHJ25577.1 Bacteriophage holin [Clostridium cavendishii DSM 21758]
MNKQFWERFKNPWVIVTITSLVILILVQNGIQVDDKRVMETVKALCSIGVILGILNNPDTKGLDLPYLKSKSGDQEAK